MCVLRRCLKRGTPSLGIIFLTFLCLVDVQNKAKNIYLEGFACTNPSLTKQMKLKAATKRTAEVLNGGAETPHGNVTVEKTHEQWFL